MTENRLFAGWLRSLTGLVAVAGVLGLSACGGGGGAPNNPFVDGQLATALQVLPAVSTSYSGVPATLTVSGGRPPYSVFSSDPSVLPLTLAGSAITAVPSDVDAETAVTVTVRDSVGATILASVDVKSAPLLNSLKLKADAFPDGTCPNAGGGSSATDDAVSTFICAGQTGSVAVRLKNTVGGGLAGRQIRFDVVQGDFQLFTNGPGQPPTYALSYTVPTDQNGDAVARVRASPNANQQLVIVQATDLLSGTFVRGIFVIANGDGLLIVPDAVTITGPDTETCSSGVITTFYIFGGLPPYTISNTLPQFLSISRGVVNSSGSGFNVTTLGGCVDSGIVVITDSAGHTKTVTITNAVGTKPPPIVTTNIPIVITPATIPTLTCGGFSQTTTVLVTGGGTVSQQGSAPPVPTPPTAYFVSVNRPDILQALPTPLTGAPPATIKLTRLNGSTVTPPPSSAVVNTVTLTVSDGNQQVTKTVPLTNTCP